MPKETRVASPSDHTLPEQLRRRWWGGITTVPLMSCFNSFTVVSESTFTENFSPKVVLMSIVVTGWERFGEKSWCCVWRGKRKWQQRRVGNKIPKWNNRRYFPFEENVHGTMYMVNDFLHVCVFTLALSVFILSNRKIIYLIWGQYFKDWMRIIKRKYRYGWTWLERPRSTKHSSFNLGLYLVLTNISKCDPTSISLRQWGWHWFKINSLYSFCCVFQFLIQKWKSVWRCL